MYLQQSHADADAGLTYRWRGGAELDIGYHFTYFFQHEHSHEDDNLGPAGTDEWMAFVRDSEGNTLGLVEQRPRA